MEKIVVFTDTIDDSILFILKVKNFDEKFKTRVIDIRLGWWDNNRHINLGDYMIDELKKQNYIFERIEENIIKI